MSHNFIITMLFTLFVTAGCQQDQIKPPVVQTEKEIDIFYEYKNLLKDQYRKQRRLKASEDAIKKLKSHYSGKANKNFNKWIDKAAQDNTKNIKIELEQIKTAIFNFSEKLNLGTGKCILHDIKLEESQIIVKTITGFNPDKNFKYKEQHQFINSGTVIKYTGCMVYPDEFKNYNGLICSKCKLNFSEYRANNKRLNLNVILKDLHPQTNHYNNLD